MAFDGTNREHEHSLAMTQGPVPQVPTPVVWLPPPVRPAPAVPPPFPAIPEPLEEVGAATAADAGAALAFGMSRLAAGAGRRPLVLVTTALWLAERGRPFGRGLARWGASSDRLIWVRCEREAEALWALEEALKSGAVEAGLATVERPAFVATRRLDFAARTGGALG